MRYFFHISYRGTNYRGWQRQPNVNSIQATIEDEMNRILRTDIYIVGCGRTDAGVHASRYYFHADLPIGEEAVTGLRFRLNKALPDDIAVHDICKVHGKFHAQHHAIARTYTYYIHTHKNPFCTDTSTLVEERLDTVLMQKAAMLLTDYEDFRAFCKTPDKHNHTRCKVSKAQVIADKMEGLRFEITANRFLRGMVRIIVHRLIEVGKKRMTLAEFEALLITKERPKFINFAPPQGLFLSDVTYSFTPK